MCSGFSSMKCNANEKNIEMLVGFCIFSVALYLHFHASCLKYNINFCCTYILTIFIYKIKKVFIYLFSFPYIMFFYVQMSSEC